MLISITAVRLFSDTPRCWSSSCVRGLSTRPVSLFSPHERKGFFKAFFKKKISLIPLPQDPYSVGCQASAVQKHASFFNSSPFWYWQKRLLWNSLSACSLAWTSLMSDCSLFLAWTQRSGDGFARQMRLSVCGGVKWHQKAVSASWGYGESQHYTHVKSIKNKSAHDENTDLWLRNCIFPLSYQTRNDSIFKQWYFIKK